MLLINLHLSCQEADIGIRRAVARAADGVSTIEFAVGLVFICAIIFPIKVGSFSNAFLDTGCYIDQ